MIQCYVVCCCDTNVVAVEMPHTSILINSGPRRWQNKKEHLPHVTLSHHHTDFSLDWLGDCPSHKSLSLTLDFPFHTHQQKYPQSTSSLPHPHSSSTTTSSQYLLLLCIASVHNHHHNTSPAQHLITHHDPWRGKSRLLPFLFININKREGG